MKQRKNNKKGFTLVELLATITILAVVVIVAVPIVTSVVRKFNSNYYTILEGNLKIAGTDYFTDHKKEIPKYTYESSQVDVEKLVQDGYLEKSLTDEKGTIINSAYVITYKTDKGKYVYQACINTDDYNTEAEYCKAEYTIQDNIILVPPSNGIIAIPEKLETYKMRRDSTSFGKKLVTVYGATLQTKVSNEERKLQNTVISPSKAVISCEKKADCSGISRTLTGSKDVIENGIKKVITDFIGNPATDAEYVKKLNAFLDKKVKVLYTYEYKYNKTVKTVEALYNIIKATETEEPSPIQVVLTGTDGDIGGMVYDDDGPDDNSHISWGNEKVVATLSPVEKNERRITQYYCIDKGEDIPYECNGDDVVKNGRLNVPYDSKNGIITVYGRTKYGVFTPNSVTYSIKTDSSIPDKKDITVLHIGTKGNNDWYTSKVSVNAAYNGEGANGIDKHISGYTIQKNIGNNSWNISSPNVSYYEVLNQQESSTSFKVKVCTIAGNCSEEILEDIKIDVDKPSIPTSKVNNVEVNSYNGSWTKGNITWSDFYSTSTSGIDHYEYSTNCSKKKSGDLSLSYTYPLNNAKVMDDKFCIRAVSESGNVSDWSRSYNFRIDNTTPSIELIAKEKENANSLNASSNINNLDNYKNNEWTNKYVFLKVKGNFGASGGSVNCVINAATSNSGEKGSFTTYKNIDYDGTTDIKCTATSTTGNTTDKSFKVQLDHTPPTVTVRKLVGSSGNGGYGCGSPVLHVEYGVSDSGSGVFKVYDVFGYDNTTGDEFSELEDFVYEGSATSVSRTWGPTNSRTCRGIREGGETVTSTPGSHSNYRIKIGVKDNVGNTAVYWSNCTVSTLGGLDTEPNCSTTKKE